MLLFKIGNLCLVTRFWAHYGVFSCELKVLRDALVNCLWWSDHFCFKIGSQFLDSGFGACLVHSRRTRGSIGGRIRMRVRIKRFSVVYLG